MIEHLIPYVERGEAALFLNAGDHAGVYERLKAKIGSLGGLRCFRNDFEGLKRYAEEIREGEAKGVHWELLSLGDSAEGRFTLRFRVRSLWDKTLSYSLELTALRDELLELLRMGEGEEELGLYNSLRPQDVSGELSLLGPSLIVVPAGETVEVELELRLSEALLARMREELPNGGFLDGFLALREFLEPCDGGADCPGAAFTDMPKPGSWAHPGIDFVLRNGYFSGSSPTAFGTKGTMDRAMTVTVLYAMAGRPEPAGSSPFPDVPMGKYYSKAVTWAAENGIVAGGSDGNFKPKGNVTREQMASILLRFAE